jgi:hypothetical protein
LLEQEVGEHQQPHPQRGSLEHLAARSSSGGVPRQSASAALAVTGAERPNSSGFDPAPDVSDEASRSSVLLPSMLLKTPAFSSVAAPPDNLCDMAFSCEIMDDPVVAADGHTYNREHIRSWLQNHHTSPKTGEVLPHKILIPNRAIR